MERAFEERDAGVARGDELTLRQAAEKGWLAVVQATDDRLARHGVHVPSNEEQHVRRKEILEGLGPEGERLSEEYTSLEQGLHGDFFYGSAASNPVRLGRWLERARRYVESATGHKVVGH